MNSPRPIIPASTLIPIAFSSSVSLFPALIEAVHQVLTQPAAQRFKAVALALLVLAGGTRDAEAGLIISVDRSSTPGSTIFAWNGSIGSTDAAFPSLVSSITPDFISDNTSGFADLRVADPFSPWNAIFFDAGAVAPAGALGSGGTFSTSTFTSRTLDGNFFAVTESNGIRGLYTNFDPTSTVLTGSFTIAGTDLFADGSLDGGATVNLWSETGGSGFISFQSIQAIPEPTTGLGLIGLIAAGFLLRCRRRVSV